MPNKTAGADPAIDPAAIDPAGAGANGADPMGAGDGDAGQAGGSDPQGGAKYSDADVDEIVKKRLARERAQIEREVRKQIEDEAASRQTEAQKLENMTELQKAQYEIEKVKAEKEALEAERDLNQQTAIARRELSAAGINLGDDLLSMFVSPDAEKTGKAIDQLKKLWPEAVNEAVQAKLRRNPPKADPPGGEGKSFGAAFAESYTKSKSKQEGGND